jgi:hypothetical protein
MGKKQTYMVATFRTQQQSQSTGITADTAVGTATRNVATTNTRLLELKDLDMFQQQPLVLLSKVFFKTDSNLQL